MARTLETEEATQGGCVDPVVDPAEQSEGLLDLGLEPRSSVDFDWVLVWEWLGPKLKTAVGEVNVVDSAHLEFLGRGRVRPHPAKAGDG